MTRRIARQVPGLRRWRVSNRWLPPMRPGQQVGPAPRGRNHQTCEMGCPAGCLSLLSMPRALAANPAGVNLAEMCGRRNNIPSDVSGPRGDKLGQEWVLLCALDEVPESGGHYIVHNGRPLAVFRLGSDRVGVYDNACPHAGASLSGGHVRDDCLICPWHGWAFDLQTGRCPDNTAFRVQTHQARVVDGRIWVRIMGT